MINQNQHVQMEHGYLSRIFISSDEAGSWRYAISLCIRSRHSLLVAAFAINFSGFTASVCCEDFGMPWVNPPAGR
jgi:hypothetical protein